MLIGQLITSTRPGLGMYRVCDDNGVALVIPTTRSCEQEVLYYHLFKPGQPLREIPPVRNVDRGEVEACLEEAAQGGYLHCLGDGPKEAEPMIPVARVEEWIRELRESYNGTDAYHYGILQTVAEIEARLRRYVPPQDTETPFPTEEAEIGAPEGATAREREKDLLDRARRAAEKFVAEGNPHQRLRLYHLADLYLEGHEAGVEEGIRRERERALKILNERRVAEESSDAS